ncbi:predicted protein [Naegleria gruberi]|uniref:Predicted protein n=1 Tax=Naegleria gruberi TaxID=5762 RepID=D2V9I8_NAEGR|nr:uncharacterized protein NAEGRDRAFT_65458 [Naegleria gruberi]EFC46468.1 predicted protein [Naegleria gruberi]|eukprot:XP_002679212.1 predicted protein [Naegleria gruberi strain NEG-M]
MPKANQKYDDNHISYFLLKYFENVHTNVQITYPSPLNSYGLLGSTDTKLNSNTLPAPHLNDFLLFALGKQGKVAMPLLINYTFDEKTGELDGHWIVLLKREDDSFLLYDPSHFIAIPQFYNIQVEYGDQSDGFNCGTFVVERIKQFYCPSVVGMPKARTIAAARAAHAKTGLNFNFSPLIQGSGGGGLGEENDSCWSKDITLRGDQASSIKEAVFEKQFGVFTINSDDTLGISKTTIQFPPYFTLQSYSYNTFKRVKRRVVWGQDIASNGLNVSGLSIKNIIELGFLPEDVNRPTGCLAITGLNTKTNTTELISIQIKSKQHNGNSCRSLITRIDHPFGSHDCTETNETNKKPNNEDNPSKSKKTPNKRKNTRKENAEKPKKIKTSHQHEIIPTTTNTMNTFQTEPFQNGTNLTVFCNFQNANPTPLKSKPSTTAYKMNQENMHYQVANDNPVSFLSLLNNGTVNGRNETENEIKQKENNRTDDNFFDDYFEDSD